jgi:hypothetical protein
MRTNQMESFLNMLPEHSTYCTVLKYLVIALYYDAFLLNARFKKPKTFPPITKTWNLFSLNTLHKNHFNKLQSILKSSMIDWMTMKEF